MGIRQPQYTPTKFAGAEQGPAKILRFVFFAGIAATLVMMAIAGVFFWYFSRGLPHIISVEDYKPRTVTRVFAGDTKPENLIGEFFKERRYVTPIDKIPDIVIKAFISAEDDRFFEHPGINIVSIIRAGIANFKAGHVVQGGSTITQQVAKSFFLSSERTVDRKVKEVILSTRLERNLSKQQILYLYLNQIYLGHGAYGVQAAAQTYFRKEVSQLSIAEAAMLAGMPQAPGKYSPLLMPKKAKERQLYVLRRLYENKYISQSQMAEAASQPLRIHHDEDLNQKYAPYLVEQIRRELVAKYGDKAVYEEGINVQTPVSRELCMSARKSLREGLLAVDKRVGFRGPLTHLKSAEEIEKFLHEARLKLIERRVGYLLLLPDGRLDPVEAMHFAGVASDADLLNVGEMYQAVVMSIDQRKKSARVMVGAARAELPAEGVKWAKAIRDEKNPNAPRFEPGSPGKILARGDVVWVKVMNKGGTPSQPEVIVHLDQEPEVQGALFSIEAQTGFVLAMEGGFDFNQSEFNRAIQAQRQPGSSFKPILYAAGIERGFTPASIIVDSPIVYETSDGVGKWKPGNFEEKFYGDTTFRQALIKSRNIPTIKIAQALGVHSVIDFTRRLGLNGQFPPDLSISLGSGSVSLIDLTKAYALFPRLGRKIKPILFAKTMDREGKTLEENAPQTLPAMIKIPSLSATPLAVTAASPGPEAEIAQATAPTRAYTAPYPGALSLPKSKVPLPSYPPADDPDQVMDPRVAYVMTHLMKEVVNYGTGHEAKQLGRPAAGKTGTTQEYNDAWFMGFTPHVVTGAWVGFDNQRSIGPGETGARAALPIWLNFMKDAVKAYPDSDFTMPPGVVFAAINAATGKPVASNSSAAIREAFIECSEPVKDGGFGDPSTPGSQTPAAENAGDFFKEDVE